MLPGGGGGDKLASEGSAGTKQLTEFTLCMLTKLMTGADPGLHLGAYLLVERISIIPAEATHMLTQFN